MDIVKRVDHRQGHSPLKSQTDLVVMEEGEMNINFTEGQLLTSILNGALDR